MGIRNTGFSLLQLLLRSDFIPAGRGVGAGSPGAAEAERDETDRHPERKMRNMTWREREGLGAGKACLGDDTRY